MDKMVLNHPHRERNVKVERAANSKIPSIFDHMARNSSIIKSNYQESVGAYGKYRSKRIRLSVLPMINCVVVALIPARDGSSAGLSGKSFQEQNGDSNENVCVSFSENWSTTRLLCTSPQEMAAFSSPSVSLSREREQIGVLPAAPVRATGGLLRRLPRFTKLPLRSS